MADYVFRNSRPQSVGPKLEALVHASREEPIPGREGTLEGDLWLAGYSKAPIAEGPRIRIWEKRAALRVGTRAPGYDFVAQVDLGRKCLVFLGDWTDLWDLVERQGGLDCLYYPKPDIDQVLNSSPVPALEIPSCAAIVETAENSTT